MEIERKFLPLSLPEALSSYHHKKLTQGYLSVAPVVRVRQEGEEYFLTYKGGGLLAREEYNLPLTEEAFRHLLPKADGTVIEKTRYYLPLSPKYSPLPPEQSFDEEFLSACHNEGRLMELDVFSGGLSPLVMAEVEFPSTEAANAFLPPEWFGEEVTMDPAFHNGVLSRNGLPEKLRK